MPDLLGTVPQWITAGGIIGFLGLIVKWRLGERSLSNAEQADIRDHYADELASLRKQIIDMGEHHLGRERELDDRWRKLLTDSEDRHSECVRQREELAARVREIEDRQIGTIRQFITFQRRIVEAMPEELKTPALVSMVESLGPFTDAAPEEGK